MVKPLRFEENGKSHSPPILLQPKKRKTDSGKFSTADRLSSQNFSVVDVNGKIQLDFVRENLARYLKTVRDTL